MTEGTPDGRGGSAGSGIPPKPPRARPKLRTAQRMRPFADRGEAARTHERVLPNARGRTCAVRKSGCRESRRRASRCQGNVVRPFESGGSRRPASVSPLLPPAASSSGDSDRHRLSPWARGVMPTPTGRNGLRRSKGKYRSARTGQSRPTRRSGQRQGNAIRGESCGYEDVDGRPDGDQRGRPVAARPRKVSPRAPNSPPARGCEIEHDHGGLSATPLLARAARLVLAASAVFLSAAAPRDLHRYTPRYQRADGEITDRSGAPPRKLRSVAGVVVEKMARASGDAVPARYDPLHRHSRSMARHPRGGTGSRRKVRLGHQQPRTRPASRR